jgi:DNA-binding NtrC family response regulator
MGREETTVPARLLIVDDEESIIFAMHDYFTEQGWEVDCARRIEEAQAMAGANAYDAVITDMHLTGLRGAEGLELVSSLRAGGSAKVIVLTAYATGALEREAVARGAHAFLQKTVPIWEVAQVATRLIAAG